MVEMKIVLRAILAAAEVKPVGDGFETARRRSITISPRRGATAVLIPRVRADVSAKPPAEPVAA